VLFIDGDVLVRADLNELFDQLDPEKALYCVQHRHDPEEGFKMDGQLQLRYRRKNWSSVMALNVDHPANAALTVDYINTVPGRELHAFGWLDDKHIGALRQEWNYLVGVTRPLANPKIAHFTLGTPDMPGYEACEYAEEWRAERRRWAA
jgi:lipopolysaccharide biosynthesis glycosyltransferase